MLIRSRPPDEIPDENSDAEKREQVFAFDVLADALKRSVEAVRFVDTLIGVLLSVQVALYAILIEGFRDTWAFRILALAGASAVIAILPTFFVREGPEAPLFARLFARDPGATRDRLIAQFVERAARNDRLRAIKVALLAVAFAFTVAALLASARLSPVYGAVLGRALLRW